VCDECDCHGRLSDWILGIPEDYQIAVTSIQDQLLRNNLAPIPWSLSVRNCHEIVSNYCPHFCLREPFRSRKHPQNLTSVPDEPSANVPSRFETQVFSFFSDQQEVSRYYLSRSQLFCSRSVGRESIRDPLFKLALAEVTRRWRLSSYFHDRDSACHGPMIPFFIPRRISTRAKRHAFWIPIWLSQTASRSAIGTSQTHYCVSEILKCLRRYHEIHYIPRAWYSEIEYV